MKKLIQTASAAAFLLSLVSLSATSASAQNQLNEHVAVDGRYLPEVTRVDRLRSTLTPLDMQFGSDPTEAALMGDPVDFPAMLMAMPATVWRAGRPERPRFGYIDASLGSWLSGRLLAGVRPIRCDDHSLGIRFDGLSTALYRPENALYRRRRLDGTLGLDLSSRFESGGTLDASVQYHLGWFNYDLLRDENSDRLNPGYPGEPASPTQTVNDIAARVGWRSPRSASVRWDAGASFRYFGYRSIPFVDQSATRESTVRIHGGIDGDVGLASTASDWGIGLDASLNTYSGDFRPGTNGLVRLNPAWNIARPLGDGNQSGVRWSARIGAKVDFSFNQSAPYFLYDEQFPDEFGELTRERFGFLHLAPDASFSIGTNLVGAYFRASGGVEEQTLARLADLDPYAAPFLTGSLPAYTPADLRVGFSITPTAGLSATVEGRWKQTRSIYAGGLWTGFIQTLARLDPETFELAPANTSYYNLHGFSLRAAVDWKGSRWIEADAEATWQPQRRATGWFNGYDRPEWTADIRLSSNPWKGLRLEAEWELRAKRSATISYALDWGASLPLDNLSDLSFGVAYEFSPRFSIGARLNNILNRKTLLAPAFISEGFGATGGLQFLF